MTMNYKEKQFSIVWEGEGKAEPSLGLPLHLTSGFDCVRSLTLSAFYDLSCLSHRLYSFLSSFPLFLSPSPLSSSFTHPAIVGCQSINKQLTSDSFSNSAPLPLSLSGIGIGTAHLLYFPSSPHCCLLYVHIYPSKCNYTL